MAKDLMVFRRGFRDAGNGLFGNDQNVRRRLRFDILERKNEIVFVNDLSRDFSSDDFFKEGFAHSSQTCRVRGGTSTYSTTRAKCSLQDSAERHSRRNITIWSSKLWHRTLQRWAPMSCFTQSR